jgi:DNA-binding MarR family transcriptional regulator
MNFSNTINYKISDLAALHRTKLEKCLSGANIHSGQVFILFELWNEDGLSQVDLVKNLKLSAPTINKMVKGLRETGFVIMKRSESDARLVNVFLSEKGKRVKSEIENIWQDLETNITIHLTETEKLIFLQLLEKVLLYFYNDSDTK